MKRAATTALVASIALSAMAQISGNGFINFAANGGAFDYNITINNPGATTIGTVWYAWVPGADYLQSLPTNVSAPSGWNAFVFGGFPGDGYSIQYVAASAGARIAPGAAMSGFTFRSTDTPAQLSGDSVFFPGNPVGMTYFYAGSPEVGEFSRFVVKPVPEPLSIFGLAPALILLRRRRRA